MRPHELERRYRWQIALCLWLYGAGFGALVASMIASLFR